MRPFIPAQRGTDTVDTDLPNPEAPLVIPPAIPAYHDGTVQDPGCNEAGEKFRTHQATATGGTR